MSIISNFLKQEADFSVADHLLAMFTYARVHDVHLGQAAVALGYDKELLREAVKYRYKMEESNGRADYGESIRTGCKRLAAAN